MKQYCRYCSHCHYGDVAYCEKLKRTMSDEKAKRINKCKNFDFLEIDVFNPEHSYKERQKASIKKMIAQADDGIVSRFHRGDFSPSLNIIASYTVSNKSLLEDYIENKEKRQMNIFEIKEEKQNDN